MSERVDINAMNRRDEELKALLDEKVLRYNHPGFIDKDPVCIPHLFTAKQDIEIAGFFAAILAWGNRTAIINSCRRLLTWMDHAPYQFVLHHQETDLKPFLAFAHRTFNATDLLYFLDFLRRHYTAHQSLEDAFVPQDHYAAETTEQALIHFRDYFFSSEHPDRTRKHIATPQRKSACKRLNMYLRWMVRKDDQGVDFGLWDKISMHQLVCPLDVHVARVAERLQLLPDNRAHWQNAFMLTSRLRSFRPHDPVVYDYALFGLGVAERL